MRIEDFDYRLPPSAIAQHPAAPRDAARLLVDRGPDEEPLDRHVRDLPALLGSGDLLVVNESRVLPVRLRLRRESGGAVEALLLEPTGGGPREWECLVRPARRLRPGETLRAPDGTPVLVLGERTAAGDTFSVTLAGERDPIELIEAQGEVPLPPYITEPLDDPERYQTVYATTSGSAAAPTAGLHFTTELLRALATRGVELARVELVVGLDTFKPLTDHEDPAAHRIHSERYHVPDAVLDRCRATRAAGGRVVAVGTTAVRALESAARTGEPSGRTRLFIHRPYEWQVVDLLITNFHLPRTTLLMMIDAFVGDRWRHLYDVALARGYRFLSFGDAMLLSRGG